MIDILAKEVPLPRSARVAIGIIIAVAGLFWIGLAICNGAWSQGFRANFRYGRSSPKDRRPVSRIGFFMFGLSWFLCGGALSFAVHFEGRWPEFDRIAVLLFLCAALGPMIILVFIEIVLAVIKSVCR